MTPKTIGLQMILRIYLARKDMSYYEFSQLVNCTPEHLSLVAREKRAMSKKMARNIEKATNSEITAKELLENKEKN